jgi:hypothetical protein
MLLTPGKPDLLLLRHTFPARCDSPNPVLLHLASEAGQVGENRLAGRELISQVGEQGLWCGRVASGIRTRRP